MAYHANSRKPTQNLPYHAMVDSKDNFRAIAYALTETTTKPGYLPGDEVTINVNGFKVKTKQPLQAAIKYNQAAAKAITKNSGRKKSIPKWSIADEEYYIRINGKPTETQAPLFDEAREVKAKPAKAKPAKASKAKQAMAEQVKATLASAKPAKASKVKEPIVIKATLPPFDYGYHDDTVYQEKTDYHALLAALLVETGQPYKIDLTRYNRPTRKAKPYKIDLTRYH